MKMTTWMACGLAACVLAASAAAREEKPADEGEGSEFKSEVYEIKGKGEVAVLLTFEADKAVTVTTDGDKETDINLFIHIPQLRRDGFRQRPPGRHMAGRPGRDLAVLRAGDGPRPGVVSRRGASGRGRRPSPGTARAAGRAW